MLNKPGGIVEQKPKGMVCPECGYQGVRVAHTEKWDTVIERIRYCPKCQQYFYTQETIIRRIKLDPKKRENHPANVHQSTLF